MRWSPLGSAGKMIHCIGHWETWNWLVKYIPILPAWAWFCIRSGTPWFFTPSNPGLTFGGFDGENKKEMYDLLPAGTYPATRYVASQSPVSALEEYFSSGEFTFPVAVKPAIGRMGLMFRKHESMRDLRHYHAVMQVDYLLQQFVDYPLEVSIFYYRLPDQPTGAITGFVKKEYLTVKGDGRSTLWELILNYPRASFRLQEMRLRHAAHLDRIITEGEGYTLSHALNLSRGGKLISLAREKDERLVKVIDDISQHGGFYFGRYDIKCNSIEDLKNGRNYSILEFNGSGAEPHHVYGNGNTLTQALGILLWHWHILFRISMTNHQRGIPFWNFGQGLRHMIKTQKHFKLLKKLENGETMEPAYRDTSRTGESNKILERATALRTPVSTHGPQ